MVLDAVRATCFLFKIEKIQLKKVQVRPSIIPVLYCGSKWKMSIIPAMPIDPKSTSTGFIFLPVIMGSKIEVNKPAAERQVNAMDIFEYFRFYVFVK